MSELIGSGKITRKTGIRSVSYFLNDNTMFFPSNCRVLNGSETEGLLKCVKVLYNGKIKLTYSVKNLKSLKGLLRNISFGTFAFAAAKVFGIILEVRENGFLFVGNLDLDCSRIYVDPDKGKVYLCYLPLIAGSADEENSEKAFRASLADLIRNEALYAGKRAEEVCSALTDNNISTEKIYAFLTEIAAKDPGNYLENMKKEINEYTSDISRELVLMSMGSNPSMEFHINKPEYILGKSKNTSDGVIPCSTVSRRHCRILYEEPDYFIEDLDSTNGTTLNGIRLQSMKKYSLADRDIIAVSGVTFSVRL